MRHVRLRGPEGVESGTVQDGRIVTEGGSSIQPLDLDTLQLPSGHELLTPFDAPEIWCAGVTYERSRDARVDESLVKDAMMRRTVGPGAPIGVREDSRWNVPEPEIGLVLGKEGRIAGYTIGNDVSSRDIEGANPLYLPQAKVYAGACSFGPAVLVTDTAPAFQLTLRVTDEWGKILFEGETSTSRMKRSFEELVRWLRIDNPVPQGSILLTGTGLVPPDTFTLEPGHFVEIHVPEIGTLVNPVVPASQLIAKEPAP